MKKLFAFSPLIAVFSVCYRRRVESRWQGSAVQRYRWVLISYEISLASPRMNFFNCSSSIFLGSYLLYSLVRDWSNHNFPTIIFLWIECEYILQEFIFYLSYFKFGRYRISQAYREFLFINLKKTFSCSIKKFYKKYA